MRIVIVGAGSLGVQTARNLARRGHEVVIIDRNKDRLTAISDVLDCGLLHGEGTHPAVLREADPAATQAFLCLTSNDQANIIASLVGRSLGFPRILTRIEDEAFEHICMELGLEGAVIPVRAMGRYLADMTEGQDILELTGAIKGDARILLFVAREDTAVRVDALDLPGRARVTHLYRGDECIIAREDTVLAPGDEVVVVTDRRHLEQLRERLVVASST